MRPFEGRGQGSRRTTDQGTAPLPEDHGGLQLEADDLIQEASIRIPEAARTFRPETGFRFRTYAETVSGNAMTDYVRKCVTLSPPAVTLVSLDDIPPGFGPKDGVTYKDVLPDGPSRIPEKICLWKETLSELRDVSGRKPS